jgi:hypothetical protein
MVFRIFWSRHEEETSACLSPKSGSTRRNHILFMLIPEVELVVKAVVGQPDRMHAELICTCTVSRLRPRKTPSLRMVFMPPRRPKDDCDETGVNTTRLAVMPSSKCRYHRPPSNSRHAGLNSAVDPAPLSEMEGDLAGGAITSAPIFSMYGIAPLSVPPIGSPASRMN